MHHHFLLHKVLHHPEVQMDAEARQRNIRFTRDTAVLGIV